LCAWAKPIEGSCFEEFLKIEHVYLPSKLSKLAKGELFRCNFLSSSALKQCLKNQKPDIIINAIDEPAVFRVAHPTVKKIQYCHFPIELQQLFGFQQYDLPHLIYRLPYLHLLYRELKKLDAVICNSKYTLNAVRLLWKYHVPKNSLHVIHPAINTTLFEKKIKKEHKLCYIGRLAPEKGIEHVIDAFLKINKKTGASFEIVGGGIRWNRSYFEEQVKSRVLKLQREGVPIKLSVEVPYSQIVETLLTSKLFLSYNPEEHFGIVSIEAQAAGCVPIVAYGGGQEEAVKHRVTGFLIKSPESIVDYALSVLNEDKLQLKMSRAAREWASSFSREKIAQKWIDLLKKLTI
jgi:glycosyltransferase involved in cell wall biosynthesis